MDWLIITYKPLTLFRLRPSRTTDSGAQSLLVPSMWTVRTALLAQSYRLGGRETARETFELLQGLTVRISPPIRAVKTMLAWRGMGWKEESKQKKGKAPVMRDGYGYREYVAYDGIFRVALSGVPINKIGEISILACMVNYFGKWGSFFQCLNVDQAEEIGHGFAEILNGMMATKPGVIQELDDWGEGLTFEMVDMYCQEEPRLEKERALVPTILPYITRSGPGGKIFYQWGAEESEV